MAIPAGDARCPWTASRPLLLAVAAPVEVRGVVAGIDGNLPTDLSPWRLHPLGGGLELVITGVGKSAAAGGVARVVDPLRHSGVMSLGIGGSLVGGALPLLTVVAATRSVFADEGVLAPGGFTDLASMGFGPGHSPWDGAACPADPQLLAWVTRVLGARNGAVGTVSTCSGTNAGAAEVRARTGAVVESMEGAACALAASRCGVPFVEVRVISNTTGDRAAQIWDLAGACARLGEVARALRC